MSEQNPRIVPTLDTSTELAIERTRIAYERTMMAWVRTTTSLTTFVFSVYGFIQIEGEGRKQQNRPIGARGFALTLVSVGLASLLLATLEHRHNIRTLTSQYKRNQRSWVVVVAALIAPLGS